MIHNFRKINKCFVFGSIDRNIPSFINTVRKGMPKWEGIKSDVMEVVFKNDIVPRIMSKKTGNNGSNKYDNSVIIVCGNCGIGSRKDSFYKEAFKDLEKALEANNSYLLFVRGCNDNVAYFNDEPLLGFERIIPLKDYSLLKLRHMNILCVGGSVSVDKSWKEDQEKSFGKKLFWEGEEPFFSDEVIDPILKDHQVDCVVTSTSPTFTLPSTNKVTNTTWTYGNDSLKELLIGERLVMDKLYSRLITSKSKPYLWYYGKFVNSNQQDLNDMVFISLSASECSSVGDTLKYNFGLELDRQLAPNGKTLANKLKPYLKSIDPGYYDLEEGDDEAEGEEGVGLNLGYIDQIAMAPRMDGDIGVVGELHG